MALWSNTDAAASKPKYLTQADKDATLGVSVDEAQNAGNIAKGLNTPGWVKYTTYTDAQGNTRNKSEVLVSLSTITGDNDTIDPDPVITIGTQPQAASVTSPASATFTVVATATRSAVLGYQWQVSPNGTAWANITGATSATLTVEDGDAEYVDANYFRVVVSATGATSVNSSAVQVTIA
jgi:hypothetical protein